MIARIQTLPRDQFCALGDRLVAACQRLMGGTSLANNRPEFAARHPRKARVLTEYCREAIRRGKLSNTTNRKAA